MDPAEINVGVRRRKRVELAGLSIDHEEHAQVWAAWVPNVQAWLVAGAQGAARRYHADNRMFGEGSASLLAGALATIRPRRYVEVGSGFSSAVALDVNDEQRPADPMHCTFIEPYPDRLGEVLRPSDYDRCTVLREKVQLAPIVHENSVGSSG